MIYKIGSVADMPNVAFENDDSKEFVYHYARILTYEYGADRNIDTDDGGYILYCTSGTTAEAIKSFFDYTANCAELVHQQGDTCSALFILSSDYGVVIITSLADTPPEILKEINN